MFDRYSEEKFWGVFIALVLFIAGFGSWAATEYGYQHHDHDCAKHGGKISNLIPYPSSRGYSEVLTVICVDGFQPR